MRLTSSAFGSNEDIPIEYTCDGEGITPPLSILDIPDSAQSLALILEDPNAPAGTFTHWLVWNIDPQTEEIEEGEVPAGAMQGVNSGGSIGYTPPCPPVGIHHYVFTLYALNKTLDLSKGSDKEDLEEAMGGAVISQAELTGIYGRDEGDSETENF